MPYKQRETEYNTYLTELTDLKLGQDAGDCVVLERSRMSKRGTLALDTELMKCGRYKSCERKRKDAELYEGEVN